MHAHQDEVSSASVRLNDFMSDAHYRPPDVFGGHQDSLRHTKMASSRFEEGSPARAGW
jgi:hypothetical protein